MWTLGGFFSRSTAPSAPGAVLGQIPLHPGQHGVVDIHPAVHLPVVEAVHDIPDGDDGIDLDAVVLPQLVQGGAVPGAPLHAVHADEQRGEGHVRHGFEQLDGLPHGGARRHHVLDDGDPAAVLGLIAHHGPALSVILGLLAVEAVGQVPPELPVQGRRRRHRQGNPFVGGAEQGVDALRHMLLDAGGVIVPQPRGLRPGLVVPRVDEIGGFPPRLGGEVPEGEHAGAHHEVDKFLPVGHMILSLSVFRGWFWEIISSFPRRGKGFPKEAPAVNPAGFALPRRTADPKQPSVISPDR